MNYKEVLERIIDDGIEAAKRDYTAGPKLRGSIAGFERCRSRSPHELKTLLDIAQRVTNEAFCKAGYGELSDEEYWEARCAEIEIEWTCNVISAVLMNEHQSVIITPTARGVMQAAEIVGVEEAQP